MPFYSYICSKCFETFEKFHSINEIITKCEVCGAEKTVLKDYSNSKIITKVVDEQRKKSIETIDKVIIQMKQEFKQQKEEIKRNLEKEEKTI